MIKPLWSWIVIWLLAWCWLLIAGGEARLAIALPLLTSRACSVDAERESVTVFSSVRLSASTSRLIPSRAVPYRWVLTPCMLLRLPDVGPAGPPWLDERGPPDKFLGPWASCTAAGQGRQPKAGARLPCHPEFSIGLTAKTKTEGFSTGFS